MSDRIKFLAIALSMCCVQACKDQSSTLRGGRNVQISALCIDTIKIAPMKETSWVGQSGMVGDSLYFYDSELSFLYRISTGGEVGSRKLGLGHRSDELPAKHLDVAFDLDGKRFVGMGSTADVYVYDDSDNQVRKIDLKFDGEPGTYQSALSYSTWDEFNMCVDSIYAYYNILGESQGVRIADEEDYFQKAAILMKLNLKTGEQKPMGHYSDFYERNKKHVRHLPHIYFDLAEDGTFFVAYQADPSIYHYDQDFNLLEMFGVEGSNMNTDYSKCALGIQGFYAAYNNDIELKKVGYYYWMKHLNGYTFRAYRVSGTAKTDRLQIYDRQYDLIADVEVPKDFRVVGYAAPYYVTQIMTKETEDGLYFYRFKLE